MPKDNVKLVQSYLQAYADKNRAALEALIADDFSFTSPLDNALNRTTYFERCWPNSEKLEKVEFVRTFDSGEVVYMTYRLHNFDKSIFCNTEIITVKNEKISAIEVFFGWNTPHPAPKGSFIDKKSGE